MPVDIKVPSVGESITEGVLLEWFKSDGEMVQRDEPLFELETDKITMQVPAVSAGKLKITVKAGSDVEIGQVVGSIDEQASGSVSAPEKQSAPATPAAATPAAATPAAAAPAATSAGDGDGGERLSPAVRRLVAEHHVDTAQIEGSGKDGRLTKGDVLAHVTSSNSASGDERVSQAQAQVQSRARKKIEVAQVGGSGAHAAQSKPSPPPLEVGGAAMRAREEQARETRTKMSSMRRRIAQRLVQAQQNAAILTTFNEVDMSEVMALRKAQQDAFVAKHGIKLGFMSFFVKAVVEALEAVPAVAARIDGDEIVQPHVYDIGVAVGTERGLVVPVLRDAASMSYADIERRIGELAQRARDKSLTLEDLSGGCFTISNGGVYGSLLSTPILNPPQSGILGMHGIKKRPVAVGDELAVRPMMYLALSYDHRIIDGAEAVTFLKRVVECIENPVRMMIGV